MTDDDLGHCMKSHSPAEIVREVCRFAPYVDGFETVAHRKDGCLVKVCLAGDDPKREMAYVGLFVLDDKYPISRRAADMRGIDMPSSQANAKEWAKENGGKVFHGRKYEHGGVAYSLSHRGTFIDPWDSGPIHVVCTADYLSQYKPDELEDRVAKDVEWVSDAHQYGLRCASGMQALPNGDIYIQDTFIGPFIGTEDEIRACIDEVRGEMQDEAGVDADAALTEAQKVADNCMRSGCTAVQLAGRDGSPVVDVEAGIVVCFGSDGQSGEPCEEAKVMVIKDDGFLSRAFDWSHDAGAVVTADYEDQQDAINAGVLRAYHGPSQEAESGPSL